MQLPLEMFIFVSGEDEPTSSCDNSVIYLYVFWLHLHKTRMHGQPLLQSCLQLGSIMPYCCRPTALYTQSLFRLQNAILNDHSLHI